MLLKGNEKQRFVKSVNAIDRMLLGFSELKIQRLRHTKYKGNREV